MGRDRGFTRIKRTGTDGNGFFWGGGGKEEGISRKERGGRKGDFFGKEVSGKSFLCASPRLRVRFFEGSFSGKIQARKEAKDAKILEESFLGRRIRFNRMDKDGEERIRMGGL